MLWAQSAGITGPTEWEILSFNRARQATRSHVDLRARGGEVKQHYAEEACRARRHAGEIWVEEGWELFRKSVRGANIVIEGNSSSFVTAQRMNPSMCSAQTCPRLSTAGCARVCNRMGPRILTS